MSIVVKNLRHVYGEGTPYESVALDDVSLEIADGEFVSIIGHTGSGKSTLVQHLNGILKPKSGEVLVGGVNIAAKGVNLPEVRRKIGLLFQYPEYQLFEETLYKDIAFGPTNLGLSADAVDSRVREAMALTGLDFDALSERSPFELSGGQKRKAAIAGVLAMGPEALVLDEPTAGLDPRSHRDILAMIRRIREERGITIILISHNMGDVAEVSDRVYVMDGGRIAFFGTPAQVFANKARLKQSGLGLPPTLELAELLRAGGADIEGDPLTLDEAVELIDAYLERRGA
ncbi:MAG: energy-coupling factor transporter ATPase [Clostridiales Family XIII bacterium]|jgi:energy-coupling factor transport system ATP-binding protein|nr:energy-coupling factor transporter ATPase [Clostridiales Family XIII bacterium]